MPSELVQWGVMGLEALVMYILKTQYQKKVHCAEQLESTPTYELNEELPRLLQLQPGHAIDYACIEGTTYSLEQPLSSQFKQGEQGVIQQILFIEHKSKRTNGYWSDARKIIKNLTQTCRFAIAGKPASDGSSVLVEVVDPLSAEFIMDNLTTTYDNYIPNNAGILSRGVDRLFGEVSKGYQETENMLNVGVRILGFGRIVYDGGSCILEPPIDGDKRFILSTMSKKNVIRDLKGDARVIKGFMWLFGVFGAGLLAYLIHKRIRRWIEQYKVYSMYREIEQQRAELERRRESRATDQAADSDEDHPDTCIICLSKPREVVILECGHVCLCADCARLIPEPRKCPVCRGHISRYIPLYRS